MDLNTIQIVSGIIISVFGIIIVPIFRWIYMNIRSIDQQLSSKITEDKAREILLDKIDPIYDELKDIKDRLNQIIVTLINVKHQ